MNDTPELTTSTSTLDIVSATLANFAESSSQAVRKPKQSLPGLITGSVIGALFLVIVIGIVVVMHIREHKKRTLAWKAEKRDRAEAGKSKPAGEFHNELAHRQQEDENSRSGSALGV